MQAKHSAALRLIGQGGFLGGFAAGLAGASFESMPLWMVFGVLLTLAAVGRLDRRMFKARVSAVVGLALWVAFPCAMLGAIAGRYLT
jgi:hypothetical protein